MACAARSRSCRSRWSCLRRCSPSSAAASVPPLARHWPTADNPTTTSIEMLALQWLDNTRAVMDDIQATQLPAIRRAAELMAGSIAAERWVHTFGCGHATIPVEEMYPRIGGFVGFHPMVELPLTFFTRITGEMGIHQFLFLERAEG